MSMSQNIWSENKSKKKWNIKRSKQASTSWIEGYKQQAKHEINYNLFFIKFAIEELYFSFVRLFCFYVIGHWCQEKSASWRSDGNK